MFYGSISAPQVVETSLVTGLQMGQVLARNTELDRNEFHEYLLGHNAYKDKICGVKKSKLKSND